MVRATRGFVGAFGAGISLAIASSVLLLIVSSVVAFRGWPDDLNGTSEPDVAKLSRSSQAQPQAAASAVALPPAVVVTAPVRADGVRASATTVADGTAGEQTSADAAGDTGAQTAASEPAGDTASGSSSSGPAAKTDVVGAVAGTVQQTTDAVAGAVAPVVPDVGSALQSVGAAGNRVVSALGH